MKIRTAILSFILFGAASLARAEFVINSSPGLFDPSFRGDVNTTWFGWGPTMSGGGFGGVPNNMIVDGAPPNIGTTTLNVEIAQDPTTTSILSSGKNIYTGGMSADTDLNITIPTLGDIGTGFTTIIIQGRTAFGGFVPASMNADIFKDINGVSAQFVMGTNTSGQGQFWAKYEIPGNLASYDFTMGFLALGPSAPVSIAELEIDTQWSSTGYAPDTAAVPEPSTLGLLGLTSLGAVWWIKRRRARI